MQQCVRNPHSESLLSTKYWLICEPVERRVHQGQPAAEPMTVAMHVRPGNQGRLVLFAAQSVARRHCSILRLRLELMVLAVGEKNFMPLADGMLGITFPSDALQLVPVNCFVVHACSEESVSCSRHMDGEVPSSVEHAD